MESGARAQSEVLGTALLIGITVISVALVVTIAGSALDSTRDTANLESAEHAMSQLDSKAALVALGRTESQTIDMGRARPGSFRVNESAGWIRITHLNYNSTGGDEQLYESELGAVIYGTSDSTVAYQGGGVWRSDGSGGSVLVSPPEFHYRGETLTIPVIKVRNPSGDGSASGNVGLHITQNGQPTAIYPSSESYPDGDAYRNPIRNGSIRVTIRSDYYRAWGSFFRDRTEGTVTVYDSNETVMVELVVPAVEGEFKMPLDGDSIKLRIPENKHAISDLNVTIAPDDSDSANFANLKWSLYAEDGSEQFELHIRSGNDMKCDGDAGAADATVYYTDGTGTYQGWTAENAFPVKCNDVDGDGDIDARIVANWTSDTVFTYGPLSSSDLLYFNPSGSLESPAKFTEHEGESRTYHSGDKEAVNYTVSHYATFFSPTLEFTVADSGGGGGTVNEDVSSGRVHYGGASGAFVTYIHVTENDINVTVT